MNITTSTSDITRFKRNFIKKFVSYQEILVVFIVTVNKDISLLLHSLTLTLDLIFQTVLKIVTYHFHFDSKELPQRGTCQADKSAF